MTASFIAILNMSITASVVALAVMLVRVPLKKAPKIFSYALWGVVLFRLICPFSIESVFSIMPTSTNAIPQDIIYSQSPAIETGLQVIDTPINIVIGNAVQPVNPENNIIDNFENNTNPIHTILSIAGYVWLLGFIALMLYATNGYIRLKRRVYFATLVRDNIYETDKVKTPFVLGFIRPKIYIPIGITPAQQDYILKHEQTHIKRHDYLIKPFAFIVFALHWFNPLMWAAYFLMSKDIEMSCDEAVLRKADDDIRGVYSSSLLNLSVSRASLLTPLAFWESDVKERVKNVLKFEKPSRVITIVAMVLVAVLSIGFVTNRAVSYFQEPPVVTNPTPNETPSAPVIEQDPVIQKIMKNIDNREIIDEAHFSSISSDPELAVMLKEYNEQTRAYYDFFYDMATRTVDFALYESDWNPETQPYYPISSELYDEMVLRIADNSLYSDCTQRFLDDPLLAPII